MATVPKPPSTLARIATVDSRIIPFGRLGESDRETRGHEIGIGKNSRRKVEGETESEREEGVGKVGQQRDWDDRLERR